MGAGKRVRNDILPALKAIGISEKDLLIVRKNYATLDDFPKIKVITDYKFLEFENIAKNIILISSIPQSDTIAALSRLLKIVTPKAVLIDTPIFDIAKYVQATMNEHGIEINILEDGGLIPWLNVFNQTKLVRTRFFLSFRAFYLFHGVSSFRNIIGEYKFGGHSLLHGRILYCHNDKRRHILQIGSRNYANGRFFWIMNKKIVYLGAELKWAKIFSRITLKDIIPNEYYLELYQIAKKFDLDADSLFENPIKYMHEWKRIGLYLGLSDLLNGGEIVFHNLKIAISNELICGIK